MNMTGKVPAFEVKYIFSGLPLNHEKLMHIQYEFRTATVTEEKYWRARIVFYHKLSIEQNPCIMGSRNHFSEDLANAITCNFLSV